MKTLITCHVNADCDAFAAMLAARHLYTDADLLFPGTQEPNLARVYSSLDKAKYNLIEASNLDINAYQNLVIVDTSQKARLGHVDTLLEKANLKIEIWDHHPPSPDDLAGAKSNIFKTGAVTSALCEILKEKDICLDADEATLIGLGIYADTGSFTYSSTTPMDFSAASWLLAHGMDVNKINDMACHELTSAQVQALNGLLESARTYMIKNVPVVLAEVSLEHYLGDFAYLAHKLMEMEKFTVLFAIGMMDNRIQVVARSRSDAINVGEICAELGGGGHVYAASASLRSGLITDVRETILRRLSAQVAPEKCASDYMTSPAIGIELDATIREADELMLHFGLKAIPVFRKGHRACAGLLSAETAARAASHGLGNEKVEEYMQRRISTLSPRASINELAEIIIGTRQRLVPIVERDIVMGVVSQTDLINVFASEAANIFINHSNEAKFRNVSNLITERLSSESQKILRLAAEAGRKLGLPVYAVGGFARDLILNYPNHDIDLVVETNGIALARELANQLCGRVREHEKFLTSVVIYHDDSGQERHIDVATARLEYYEYPAALPTVELSSIKMDLYRRDFSINALAIRLDTEPMGQLVDFFGGRRDIKDCRIRVLHTLSFVEDPTRCIRAVRFEQRYKFRIGPGTEKLIKNMLPMRLLEKLSPHRIFNEFRLLCEEETTAESLARMHEIGILKALNPCLSVPPQKTESFTHLNKIISWYKRLYYEEQFQPWICWFYALVSPLNYAEASACYESLGLPEIKKSHIMRQRELLRQSKARLLQWQKKYEVGKGKVSNLKEMLDNFSLETLLFCMAAFNDSDLEKNISRYITQWRREKADINGNDLLNLGVPQGPEMAVLLKFALTAKLDGKAPTAARQLSLVKAKIKKDRYIQKSALALNDSSG